VQNRRFDARIRVTLAGALFAIASCSGGGGSGGHDTEKSAGVFTQRNDAQRSGLNTNESVLTHAAVSGPSFGKQFSCPIDGEAYAQPLVVADASIQGKGVQDVVFVATQNDSVYAFDANANPCIQYWKHSFLSSGIEPVPQSDVGTDDISPQIGITGTPVIDPATNTLYVVVKTREKVGTGCSVSSPCYHQRLHALDLSTGMDKLTPEDISSTSLRVNGSGAQGDSTCPPAAPTGKVPFCPLRENQRPALLLQNGRVYIAWASHGDTPPYHGWVTGYSTTNLGLAPVVFNATPDGDAGGIWMSGTGPSADAAGNIYVITGNGAFDTDTPRTNYGDSFLKLTSGLGVADFFTPFNQADLSDADADLGSGGALILPDAAGSQAHPHLLVGGSKEGALYLIDRDDMTQFDPNQDNVLDKVGVSSDGIFSTPLYWQGSLFVVGVDDVLKRYTLAGAQLSDSPVDSGSVVFGFPGATPVLSANGTSDAILWMLDTSDNGTPNGSGTSGPAILYAYDPETLSVLYQGTTGGDAVKFTVPTVVNGKVYVGTQTELTVFGLP
jgi:hypothetical protein